MTATEWLKMQLGAKIADAKIEISEAKFFELIKQAKEMEKQDLITSYAFGHNDGCRYMTNQKQEFEHGESYFLETFKQKL